MNTLPTLVFVLITWFMVAHITVIVVICLMMVGTIVSMGTPVILPRFVESHTIITWPTVGLALSSVWSVPVRHDQVY